MSKYEYKQETVKRLMLIEGLSSRKFCKAVGLSNGTFWRFMYCRNELSDKNKKKIYAYAKHVGLEHLFKKSIWKRIVDFIKG